MLYSIYSTKRSGHHTFIEWMVSGLDRGWVYFNNCKVSKGGGLIIPFWRLVSI